MSLLDFGASSQSHLFFAAGRSVFQWRAYVGVMETSDCESGTSRGLRVHWRSCLREQQAVASWKASSLALRVLRAFTLALLIRRNWHSLAKLFK